MKLLIIGAGPAGVTVAETLRQHDAQSSIVMLSSEPYPPYSPPAMLEYFQTGQDTHFWKGEGFAERLDLDYCAGTEVVALMPDEHAVKLADGKTLDYEAAVIATGSRLYAPVDGADMPGIYNFKSLTAAEALVKKVRSGKAKNALIVGAGFIGVEIALLLRDLGLEVTQIEMEDRVMPRMLDIETGDIVVDAMRARGIDVRLETKATAFTGKKRAEAVALESGETLPADLLVATTGVKPNIDFLEGSGAKADWGITVDDRLRTNLPDVYAAGDVAETFDRLTGEQYVHAIFPNAVEQGKVVAHNLLGEDLVYEGAENMNSLKHLGLPLIAGGQATGEELRVQRGAALRKVYIQDDRIVGYRLAGDLSAAGIFRTLMNKGVNVSQFKNRLLKPGFGMGAIQDLALSPLYSL
ncbi:MAG: FAD-dependent oxidoreductase [Anaerolineales bacterium]|jgi:NAD(P)H-nitrite reductase large subunit